jgi:hypothetical protein
MADPVAHRQRLLTASTAKPSASSAKRWSTKALTVSVRSVQVRSRQGAASQVCVRLAGSTNP